MIIVEIELELVGFYESTENQEDEQILIKVSRTDLGATRDVCFLKILEVILIYDRTSYLLTLLLFVFTSKFKFIFAQGCHYVHDLINVQQCLRLKSSFDLLLRQGLPTFAKQK